MNGKKKCRQYCADYIKYGSVNSPSNEQLPMCLLCKQVFSNEGLKSSRMIDHLKWRHSHKVEKDVQLFIKLRAVAKQWVESLDGRSVIKSIPLSNDTVPRRINLMASDVEKTLYSILKTAEFSLQIDESPLPGNEALLLAYVRYILEGIIVEEMLFASPLVTETKASALKEGIFRRICHHNETEFERLLLHAEVRWLSKGKCLSRFYSLFDTILEFLEEENPQLMQLVIAAKSDVAYLTDIFDKFNAINLQLQGNLITLVKCKTVVSSFIGKLTRNPISDDDLLAYCEHLEVLRADMIQRFTDLLELEPPHWLFDPFCVDVLTVPPYLQEELMDLQSGCEEDAPFAMMGYERFSIAIAGRNKFPYLWKVAKLLVWAFPTSYLVDRGFTAVVQLLTKQRNKLDIFQCGDLRLLQTDMKPDANGIIDDHHINYTHLINS
ncbi:hypothetical protein LOD99_3086 [Oopsacas minuta]|uniref:Uncharacterized protein n=1 Tax=Oopsacas minuta TaxID=111878 RepID=A0AAV7JYK9_9METZ|nr:hypothetical protein LOD99_3086 [Oopsacas minuta]